MKLSLEIETVMTDNKKNKNINDFYELLCMKINLPLLFLVNKIEKKKYYSTKIIKYQLKMMTTNK